MASQSTQLEDTHRLWEQVLEVVQGRIGSQQAFDTWFAPIRPLRLNSQVVELHVPNSFFVDWIHQHHLEGLREALRVVLGDTPSQVRFTSGERVAETGDPPNDSRPEVPRPSAPRAESLRAGANRRHRGAERRQDAALNPRHTFANFVVGSSNQFTHAACRAVADRPGESYNPLFIFAGSGLGKTHLLHAVGHEIRRTRPDAKICYVSAERFTNEMIYAIQHAQTLAFRNKYRSVDLLLIDDIQFLAGKESTQEEFFYTFNALRDAHKQIVVTADKPPKDIPMLEERLISRFNQGLVTDIKQPDLETRLAILRNRCDEEGEGVRPPDDVLLLIADRVRNNVRDLEGCLVRVLALASLVHQEVTSEMVEELLQHYVHPEPDATTPERIIGTVAEGFQIKPDALVGRRRTQSIVLPRQVAMYLLRQLTELSLVEIGAIFGGRDHTTVIYALERIGQRIASDIAFADKVNGLISTLSA